MIVGWIKDFMSCVVAPLKDFTTTRWLVSLPSLKPCRFWMIESPRITVVLALVKLSNCRKPGISSGLLGHLLGGAYPLLIYFISSFGRYRDIGHFGKYHNHLCLFPQILHKHCFQFLLKLTMAQRENKNNSHAKFGGTNKEYYGIFRSGL